jgi:hypothetical protein
MTINGKADDILNPIKNQKKSIERNGSSINCLVIRTHIISRYVLIKKNLKVFLTGNYPNFQIQETLF